MLNGNRGSACKAPTTYDLSPCPAQMYSHAREHNDAHSHTIQTNGGLHDRALLERLDSGARAECHAHLFERHIVHVP